MTVNTARTASVLSHVQRLRSMVTMRSSRCAIRLGDTVSIDSTSDISASTSSAYVTASTSSSSSLRPFANLDLSDDQRSQIRSILASAKQSDLSPAQVRSQIESVLSPEQKTAFQADTASAKRASTHHRHHGAHAPAQADDASSQQAEGSAPASVTAPTVNGLTSNDVRNQAAAGTSLALQQLANDLSSTYE